MNEIAAKTLRELRVDANDPEVQRMALTLAQGLIAQLDLDKAVAVGLVTTAELLTAILHAESPMPEQNIQSVERLLTDLTEIVLKHRDCALRINDVSKKPVVH